MGCGHSRVSPAPPGHLLSKLVFLVVGLDNAGKSTTIRRIAGQIDGDVAPTVGVGDVVDGTVGGTRVELRDVGGSKEFRALWSTIFPRVHGIVYVVDCSEEGAKRIQESRTELQSLLSDPRAIGKPIVILANKQDRGEGCLRGGEVEEKLGVERLLTCRHRTFETAASDMSHPGTERAFTWLTYVGVADVQNLGRRIHNEHKSDE